MSVISVHSLSGSHANDCDWYIFEIEWFQNWCPQDFSGPLLFQGALDFVTIWTSLFMMPTPQSFSLMRTKMDDFPGLIFFWGPRRIICRGCHIPSRGGCLALEFTLQKSSLKRLQEWGLLQLALLKFQRVPLFPLETLDNPGTHFYFWTHASCEPGIWRWEEKPQWCWQSEFSVLNSDAHSSWR